MANISKPTGLGNIWASGGTKVNPGDAKVNIGWVVQLPPYEFQNWVDNRQDQAIAHISQHGIPEWDSVTEYQGLISYTQGSNGVIYKCTQTNTNKDPANSLNSAYWVVAFESFGSVAVVTASLNQHILNYQTLSSVGNPAAARSNLSLYSRAESNARFASLNGSSAQVFSVGIASQPEHAVRLGQVASLLTQATESSTGVIRLATSGLTEGGTDDLTAITPLKAGAVFLKRSGNLSGLTNIGVARVNLGLGTMAVEDTNSFLRAGLNLSDVLNVGAARANLGLTSTATLPETYFMRVSGNLSDLTNAGVARNNLGLSTIATMSPTTFLQAANNLSDITNAGVARNSLGLSDTATMSSGNFLFRSNNLSDLTNPQAARNSLQLGNAATMNIYGAINELDVTGSYAESGHKMLGGGFKINWGSYSLPLGGGVQQAVRFTSPFTSAVFFYSVGVDDSAQQMIGVTSPTLSGMNIKKGVADPYARTGKWIAIGI